MDNLITEAVEQTIAKLLNAERVVLECEASLQAAGVVFKRQPDGAPAWAYRAPAPVDDPVKPARALT